MMSRPVLIGLLVFWLVLPGASPAGTQEQVENTPDAAIESLVQKIIASLTKEKKSSVLIGDFLSSRGIVTEFSRGVAEQLGRALAAHHGRVRVVEPSAVRAYLVSHNMLALDLEIKDIGHMAARALSAETVMTGETRTQGREMEIAVVLKDMPEGKVLAEETFLLPRSEAADAGQVRPVEGPDGQVVRLRTEGITEPRCLQCPDPDYSEEARRLKLDGVVAVRATVNVDGSVSGLAVFQTVGYGLESKAIGAVSKWKLAPAKDEGGQPFPCRVTIEVVFRLLRGPH